MKIVMIVLAVIGILITIPLIVALFVKKEYIIGREITISKPYAEVFNYVKYIKNQDHYNKWVMTDPAMKKHFRGADGNIGFVYAWDGNDKAGKGEQEIQNIVEGNKIQMEIRFERPFQSTAYTHIHTEAVGDNQTNVKWAMQGNSKYPLNIMNLFVDKLLGNDMEVSLKNLKGILEKQ